MKKNILLIASLIIAVILSACGNKSDSPNTGSYTYRFKDDSVILEAPPQRIIPLSASLLNMLYAVDGKAVARPTTSSEIPDAAKSLPEIGHVSHINAETLVSHNPDLVIGLTSQHQKISSIIEANKFPYILVNYDGIDDNIPLLRFFGELSGTENKAEEVIKVYEDEIQHIQNIAKKQPPLRVIVLRATGKDVTAETPAAVTASMVEQLGMKNVLTDHPNADLEMKTVPYSLEVLAVDDPDIIFIVTMGKAEQITARMQQEMTGNPAWNGLRAVKEKRVHYLPSELFLFNPGVRTPEAMEILLDLAYPDLQ